MHEASLIAALLQQVRSIVSAQGEGRVVTIDVSGGPLCGAEQELLELAFARLAPEAGFATSQLRLSWRPLTARCRACQTEFEVQDFCFVCPECHGQKSDVIAGDLLILNSVEFQLASACETCR